MIKLIKQYLKMNVKKMAEYRTDFIIGVTAIFLTNFVSVTMFWLIFQNINVMNGWTFNDILFLLGIYYLSFGIWHLFLKGITPHRIQRYITNGELDNVLTRPHSTISLLLLNEIDNDGLGDFIAGLMIFAYASNAVSFLWSLQSALMILSVVAGGVLIIFSIMLLLSSVSFLVVRSGILSEFFWSISKFAEFPLSIYNPAIRFVLTFIFPFGFVSYYPAQYFLGKGGLPYLPIITLSIGVIFAIVGYRIWKLGLKSYTSTGS
jgi:ABC-2 type transport system permease protein